MELEKAVDIIDQFLANNCDEDLAVLRAFKYSKGNTGLGINIINRYTSKVVDAVIAEPNNLGLEMNLICLADAIEKKYGI